MRCGDGRRTGNRTRELPIVSQRRGASVIVGDLRAPENDTLNWKHLDVTDCSSIEDFVNSLAAEQGGIDILVNNAGIMFEKTLDEQSEADWDRMMAVNLKGPFLMAKHVSPWMVARGGGAIVNVGSVEGIACNPGHTAYAASKAGVHGTDSSTCRRPRSFRYSLQCSRTGLDRYGSQQTLCRKTSGS